LPKTATRQRRDCDLKPGPSAPESSTLITRLPSHPHKHCRGYYASRPRRHTGIVRSVRLSVPWRSCLGYRHAGCLQLSHRRPPEMCGLRTGPRTDVDLPRFLDRTDIGRGHIVSPQPGRYLLPIIIIIIYYYYHGFLGLHIRSGSSIGSDDEPRNISNDRRRHPMLRTATNAASEADLVR